MRDLPAAKSVLIESHGRVGVRGRHIYIYHTSNENEPITAPYYCGDICLYCCCKGQRISVNIAIFTASTWPRSKNIFDLA
jgi:hypothetical protein